MDKCKHEEIIAGESGGYPHIYCGNRDCNRQFDADQVVILPKPTVDLMQNVIAAGRELINKSIVELPLADTFDYAVALSAYDKRGE